MNVLSSKIIKNIQVDGRFCVREEHTLENGNVMSFDYMCGHDFDCDERALQRVQEIAEMEEPTIEEPTE